jgi:cell division protein ZapA (FtsZ GTPase activity inhibitor)
MYKLTDLYKQLKEEEAVTPPTPYKIEFAKKVLNPKQKETTLHNLLSQYTERINPKREFFKIEPEQAIAILKLLHTEDATSEVEHQPTTLDQESIIAAKQLKSKRPMLRDTDVAVLVALKIAMEKLELEDEYKNNIFKLEQSLETALGALGPSAN